jgi:hypothetical protein
VEKARNTQVWIVMPLLVASVVLAVYDLYLILSAISGTLG